MTRRPGLEQAVSISYFGCRSWCISLFAQTSTVCYEQSNSRACSWGVWSYAECTICWEWIMESEKRKWSAGREWEEIVRKDRLRRNRNCRKRGQRRGLRDSEYVWRKGGIERNREDSFFCTFLLLNEDSQPRNHGEISRGSCVGIRKNYILVFSHFPLKFGIFLNCDYTPEIIVVLATWMALSLIEITHIFISQWNYYRYLEILLTFSATLKLQYLLEFPRSSFFNALIKSTYTISYIRFLNIL